MAACIFRASIMKTLLAGALLLAPLFSHAASVATFSPQGEVKAPQQVRISFSTPMVRLGDSQAAAPLQWDCRLDGSGHWVDDKSWVLDLRTVPDADTRCRFSLKSGLKDVQGV
ncbi:hypothetical protein CV739_00430, partial [Bacillus velezensis]